MKKKIWVIGIFLLISFVIVMPVFAQGSTPPTDDEINAIAGNMYCPVCENIPLDVCPTQACEQWRQQISDMLVDGSSEQEIYDFFALQYGDRVLAAPPRTGLNWLIYIVPPLAIIIFGVVFFTFMRRNQQTLPQAAGVETREVVKEEGDDDYKSRLEKELEKRL